MENLPETSRQTPVHRVGGVIEDSALAVNEFRAPLARAKMHLMEKYPATWDESCYRFLEYAAEVMDFTQLTRQGIGVITGIPRAVEALMSKNGDPRRAAEEQKLANAKRKAKLAGSEIKNDFPLLHGHALMGLWGALEAMVEDLSISCRVINGFDPYTEELKSFEGALSIPGGE